MVVYGIVLPLMKSDEFRERNLQPAGDFEDFPSHVSKIHRAQLIHDENAGTTLW